MKYYLYVIVSEKGRRYIGISENPDERLLRHNSGYVRSTKGYRPWKIIYREVFSSKTDARKRELELKNKGPLREQLFAHITALSSNG
jgi:putative endonuclease